jgi:NADH:ubiquinone oxidoreductase subunit K
MKYIVIFLLGVKELPLIVLLNFSFILFSLGLVGIIWNKKNFLTLILCIEMMFFSISLNFIFFSVYLYNSLGQIFCLLVVTSAAAETAIGLSLLVVACRLGNEVSYDSLVSLLKFKKKLIKRILVWLFYNILFCFIF